MFFFLKKKELGRFRFVNPKQLADTLVQDKRDAEMCVQDGVVESSSCASNESKHVSFTTSDV